MTVTGWAVEVSDVRVLATGAGVDWWLAFRQRFDPAGRITVTASTFGGEVVSVACDGMEDAESLAATMIRNGLPKTAVKPRRVTA